MRMDTTYPTAAQRLVQGLIANGVDRVFCVPGESYLPVLDALGEAQDRIETIVCRHEAGACVMAEAHAKLTGRPGVCFVTRGPGATQASIGVHTARQDSTPLILFIGQVALADREREAFQEVDYRAFFGPLTKWATELERPERTAELLSRAFATAMQGRRGPVAIALPEDVLDGPAGPDASFRSAPAAAAPNPAVMAQLAQRLALARRPLMLLGGSGWDAQALDNITAFAAQNAIPTVLSFRRKDLIDNTHPVYAGDLGLGPNPKLLERVRAADLLIVVGARLGENPSQGYTLLSRADTAAHLFHFHPDPEELGRVWPAAGAAAADVAGVAEALANLRVAATAWRDWCAGAHADAVAFRAPLAFEARVNLSEVFAHLAHALPDDAIIANGAGNYAAWLHRFYVHRRFNTQLAPTSGAMGYGLPAAIAAKLAHPARTVIAVGGDGCFQMASAEMATATQYDAAIIALVVDNASYGTIRMHQDRRFPGRPHATTLKNPDFSALARAHGWAAWTVATTTAFAPALAAAQAAGGPALLHIKTDLHPIAPSAVVL